MPCRELIYDIPESGRKRDNEELRMKNYELRIDNQLIATIAYCLLPIALCESDLQTFDFTDFTDFMDFRLMTND